MNILNIFKVNNFHKFAINQKIIKNNKINTIELESKEILFNPNFKYSDKLILNSKYFLKAQIQRIYNSNIYLSKKNYLSNNSNTIYIQNELIKEIYLKLNLFCICEEQTHSKIIINIVTKENNNNIEIKTFEVNVKSFVLFKSLLRENSLSNIRVNEYNEILDFSLKNILLTFKKIEFLIIKNQDNINLFNKMYQYINKIVAQKSEYL